MFEAELASAKLKEFALPLLHEENEDGGEEFFERDPRLTYIVRWWNLASPGCLTLFLYLLPRKHSVE
ncbi:hypothetical protein B0H13DRAFT_2329579 [Mycena leptocephala]|nr:hypothetical protein B0H13DRAFT_2329579 [Mycena leptocephala]